MGGWPSLTNGYAAVLDSALLAQLGVTRDTPQPSNGKILMDNRGEPTGLVLGAAELLQPVRRSPPHTFDDVVWALKTMQKRYN